MRIRKGKNIYFRLTVTLPDGTPEDFTDAGDINIAISGPAYKYLPEITLENNVISFQYPGDKNVHPGEFGVHLKYVKPNVASITGIEPFFLDISPAFTIVDSSSKENFIETAENTEIVTVAIAGQVNIIGMSQGGDESFEKRLESLEEVVYGNDTGSVSQKISQAFTWEEHYKSNN